MKTKTCWILAVISLSLLAVALSCRSSTPAATALVEQRVSVPSGGNTAEVVFSAKQGQKLRISLEAESEVLEPYGYLTYPDGSGDYFPRLEDARDGKNSAEITLSQDGAHTLAIMEGTNQGGAVQVKVAVVE